MEKLNKDKAEEVASHIKAAIENVVENVRWRFVNPSGPRVPKVTIKEPIMWK